MIPHYHPVCLLVSTSLNQSVNSIFLSQQISTSQSKPTQKPISEHAVWMRTDSKFWPKCSILTPHHCLTCVLGLVFYLSTCTSLLPLFYIFYVVITSLLLDHHQLLSDFRVNANQVSCLNKLSTSDSVDLGTELNSPCSLILKFSLCWCLCWNVMREKHYSMTEK